jgi:hypothetical protein
MVNKLFPVVNITSKNMEKMTSDKWYAEIYPNQEVKILDSDGWDRSNYQHSYYEEEITRNEFEMRVMKSTCAGWIINKPVKTTNK